MPRAGGFPSARRAEYATRTTAELHLYADGTSGNDANDGLTAVTPKKTLQAILTLARSLASIKDHSTVVHMSGTFSEQGHADVRDSATGRIIVAGGSVSPVALILDGGWDRVDVAGGTKTATGSSTSTVSVAGAGWGVDAWFGYAVKVLTGPAAGNERAIYSNTADTITVSRDFTVDPGVGATFQIVRPATEWTASSTNSWIYMSGAGQIIVQNLYVTGTKTYLYGLGCTGGLTITNVLLNGGKISIANAAGLYLNIGSVPYKTDGNLSVDSTRCFHVLIASTSSTVTISQGAVLAACYMLTKAPVNLNGINIWSLLSGGSRSKAAVSVNNCMMSNMDMLGTFSGYRSSKIDSVTGVGLTINNCLSGGPNVKLDASATIENCSSHAIEVTHSTLEFEGATSGTGNAGAGVYAHSGSVVHTKSGTPPTITGTVGDFSTDGTTQASTWAAIEAGTPVADHNEFTMAKKVA